MKKRDQEVVAGVAVTAALMVVAMWCLVRPGTGALPLDRSSFLRDVVEPITIVEAMSFDDGGSLGVQFKDARGVVRDICLDRSDSFDDKRSDFESSHSLILNSFFSHHHGKARPVPISGEDERATLGLLERWAHQDSDARELDRRMELYKRRKLDLDAFWKGLSDECRIKQVAVGILRELRSRNGVENGLTSG